MTFISRVEVLALHRTLIDLYGGSHGVRDEGLLASALAQPEASFGGEYLHGTLAEMAAAYAFHLAKNHPFVDGNQRIAFAMMLTFLEVNDEPFIVDPAELYAGAMAVAEGRLDKPALAAWIADRLPRAPAG